MPESKILHLGDKCKREAKFSPALFQFVYTDTYAAIKQTLLWITIFKDTLCLPQQLVLIGIIKRCPLFAKSTRLKACGSFITL